MNFNIFALIFTIVMSIIASTALAGKDDGTIIIGENGGIVYKGGKKVSQS